jgi:hypothetical protein
MWELKSPYVVVLGVVRPLLAHFEDAGLRMMTMMMMIMVSLSVIAG